MKKYKKVNKKAITTEYEKLTSEITSLLQLGSTQVSIHFEYPSAPPNSL
jgi:hypothetical protein